MSQHDQHFYEFGPYRLNPAQQLLSQGNKKVPLTPKAFQTLLVLVEAQGRVVAKDELLQKVWPDTFVEEATLAQNVFTLRKQLQDDRDGAVYIETVPKRGYRFVAAVRVHEPPATPEPSSIAEGPQQIPQQPRTLASTRWIGLLMVTVVIAAAAAYWFAWSRSRHLARASDRVMLAVLPVKNLTGDASQDYLADGLTEEVIADLGTLNPQRLGVIARTSAMAYKETNKTIKDIAGELGADYVLESSLRGGSGHVRFTAQLIRTQDQSHVWAHNYDRAMADVLAMQSELAMTVAEEIRIGLPSQVAARLASPRAVQPEAYDNYLKGRFFWNKRTADATTTAESYFRQAIQADPKFAPAYAGLADCYQVMVNLDQLTANDGFSRARGAALKAVELDDTLAEAHTSLASIEGDFDWNWSGAEAEYKLALQLNPNYATAHHWYGEFLAGIGRLDEATAEIKKAQEIDPISPVVAVTLGEMYCRAGRCQQGIEQIKKSLEIHPEFQEAHAALAEMYAHLGMYEAALAEEAKAGQPPGARTAFLLSYAAARSGHKEEALKIFHQFEKQMDWQHRDYYLAILSAAFGDNDQAFARLENARQSHDPFMAYLRADFTLESLRSDPRFLELLGRMSMRH